MRYKLINCLVLLLAFIGSAKANYDRSDLQLFLNDKEAKISSFSKAEQKRIKEKYKIEGLQKYVVEAFDDALLYFINYENFKCEGNLIDRFKKNLEKTVVVRTSEEDIENHLKYLRVSHHIDDILYELLSGINKDYFSLINININQKPLHLILTHEKLVHANGDLSVLFNNFKTWPENNGDQCYYQEFMSLRNSVKNSREESPKGLTELKILTKKSYELGLINKESYFKINYLANESFITKRDLWLQDYIKIILSAKNKMVPVSYVYRFRNIEEESSFSADKVKLFSKLTRRKILYRKYDETQIILLAQVLQKAARRMGSDPDTDSKAPVITQEFSTLLKNGSRETYVEKIELDPQSQYNLARRLMRKDILDLNVMDGFRKITITYDDIVMAALETGYISLEDIELVVKYDDLWNSPESSFEKISNFIFRVLGFSTFYLPPPWNITAAIAISIVEGIVDTQFNKKGSNNDNPATFIE